MGILTEARDFVLDILFPRFCVGCAIEGSYLCIDCQSAFIFFEQSYCLCRNPSRLPSGVKCKKCSGLPLNGLYSALPYDSPLVKKIISRFKYAPFVRELAKSCADLIINHFQLLDKPPYSPNKGWIVEAGPPWLIVSAPLHKKRLKWRGYNQSEELAKELSSRLGVKYCPDCLVKTKKTPPQAELLGKEREGSVKNVFICPEKFAVAGHRVLLVDDVYTTGSTMQECARVLKTAGARQVWGVVVARG